ncbi:MAG: sulfide dehydrogenase [flavocytochrome c] flavoprotein chain [Acetobacteraceae bacterium]|nr:sulfide dehydrogenase [flavocytochrome c] flavoprotein chain [Acetobacteraceae bacterium]
MIPRRAVVSGAAAVLAAPFIARAQGTTGKVVVVGGGFGGATAARFVHRADPRLDVVLVEANPDYLACPFSNEVIAGFREIPAQHFDYRAIAADGVRVVSAVATSVDSATRRVTLGDNSAVPYDRLILSPGIDINWGGLPGYDEAAAERMPHAWKAGAQTLLLRGQLQAMEDGGVVVISAPANPYRCPPGPYERASLIAAWLKTNRPRSKLLLLDAKDTFSKQKLFQAGWAQLYPGLLEWVSLSDGGKVTRVDPVTNTFETDFGSHKADVGNVIPPQRAGRIAVAAGVADRTGWCPIDPMTFESKVQPGIHVIGDAAIAGAMPKSAFAANAQAKVCADAVVQLLAGGTPGEPRLINTCYSLVAPGYGISVAGVYRPVNGQLTDVAGAGGVSPQDAPAAQRAQEAEYADAWFKTITGETFG